MSRFPIFVSALTILALVSATDPATAAWPRDTNNGNVALCTAATNQINPTIVSDGAGGAIVTWQDSRNGTIDIYAQRISAAGAPLWTADGVALCTATGDQLSPVIASDGAGGAIVTWQDYRGGTSYDIYAQRISDTGVVKWVANGMALCVVTGHQESPAIVSDGAGGALVAWQDYRSGTNYDIYVQRVTATGLPLWTNGVALCTAANNQTVPTIVSDGAGGALVTWQDGRGGNNDIYAQRVGAGGGPLWTSNGVALCTAANNQNYPASVPDGVGGAIVTWQDGRGGNNDIYAQRVSDAGAVKWATNGVALCTDVYQQSNATIVADGTGGVIVTWQDHRSGNFDIYAQRVSAAGVPQWTADGLKLCAAAGEQDHPMIAADGAGGAVVTWYDYRSGSNFDIYAQRIGDTGAVKWATDGVALCTAASGQYYPMIASDGAGGAIVTWQDLRGVANYDIYAQRVEHYGQLGDPEPVIASVRDVPNDQGGFVLVSWDASYLDVEPVYGVSEYRVFRSAAGSFATAAAPRRAVTEDSDVAVREGALLARAGAAGTVYWEYMGRQAANAFAGYSQVVATTSDSLGSSNPRTWFMLEARADTLISSARWSSSPDSGYSVDNLPPVAPGPFTGQYAAGTANLHWSRNTEADLTGYRLYRGTSAAFTPGPANLLAALPDTGYADAAGAPYVYKLTALDVHGNESQLATLTPSGALGVDDAVPLVLALALPGPNPARGASTLRYTLSRAGHVRLSVFDAAGRRVAVLRDGELPAGGHAESFTLRDEAGRELASGLYLLRLEAEGRVLTRRMAAIR